MNFPKLSTIGANQLKVLDYTAIAVKPNANDVIFNVIYLSRLRRAPAWQSFRQLAQPISSRSTEESNKILRYELSTQWLHSMVVVFVLLAQLPRV